MNTKNIKYLVLLLTIGVYTLTSCGKEDCDEEMDDCSELAWNADNDGDGFGDPNNSQLSCDQPAGFVLDNTDFDDTNATAYPNAEEICNDGIDNNGNGETDECLAISISGIWLDNFGSSIEITSTDVSFDNVDIFNILTAGGNYFICENDAGNNFNPNLFSKFVFTQITQEEMYLCQSFFDSPSLISIESVEEPSDSTNLETGCGGFQWSLLTRQ